MGERCFETTRDAKGGSMNDPEVRTDGLCVQCVGPRRKGVKKHDLSTLERGHFRRLAEHLAEDPFCSTECCRDWHGFVHAGDRLKDSRFDHPGLTERSAA